MLERARRDVGLNSDLEFEAIRAAGGDLKAQVALLETRFAPTEDAATVVLTTVHQAKGLEWDCVIVEDDFRPVFGNDKTQRVEVASYWQQDELNHLYVALTRAKRNLIVSRCVMHWIAAMRGLYQYRLLASNTNLSIGKLGLCPHCNGSKHALVVREYRLACFDFLNPKCNRHRPEYKHSHQPCPPTDVVGCVGCLSDPSSAAHADALADPDLALFVSTAPKITRQRPQATKHHDDAAEKSDEKPASFKLEPAKHAFLNADHRSMKWAIMHHEYKRAVYSWLP